MEPDRNISPLVRTVPLQVVSSGAELAIEVPQLFVLLQAGRPLAASARHSLAEVDEVVIGRGVERSVRRSNAGGRRTLCIEVPDAAMSKGVHARLSLRMGTCVIEDAGSTNGVFVDGQRVAAAALTDGAVVELGQTFFLFGAGVRVTRRDPDDLDGDELAAPEGLCTLIPSLAGRFAELARVAESRASIIVSGETGTGKELAARAVHALSGRTGRFVAVNCGALPETLVEGQLFGHTRGAFSGATDEHEGFIRAAHRGTLFLDEIGDLPLSSQTALLRVLQECEVVPIGATAPVSVDIRCVAATHRDLDAMVADGTFREDLLARLSGFVVTMPPLRDRLPDLGLLVAASLRRVGADAGVAFANGAVRALARHEWPRNVRELQKCLETAVALSGGEAITAAHLTSALDVRPRASGTSPPPTLSPSDAARREQLIALLKTHDGNVSAVARDMGKARSLVQRWIKRCGLRSEAFRSA